MNGDELGHVIVAAENDFDASHFKHAPRVAGSFPTPYVERSNLTVRTFMKRFTRLALGFSKKLDCLEAAVTLHMAYYYFCWQPRTLEDRMTPAMAAGLTNRPWSFAELMV